MQTVFSGQPHTYPSDGTHVAADCLKTNIKETAFNGRSLPHQIIVDSLSQEPVEVRAAVGNMESAKRTLRRHKRGIKPTEPPTLANLQIPDNYAKTLGSGDNFLIHDSGSAEAGRVIVFATDHALQHLAETRTWLMDGTFVTAPKLFEQMYIITMAALCVCVYAFLTGKTQNLYEQLFRAINARCEALGYTLDPLAVVVDFEIADTMFVFQGLEWVPDIHR